MAKRILFTGGGTAGHVMVNLALIPSFLNEGWEVSYIGSEKGIERQLITHSFPHIPYFPIATGKLRRYFDWNNFKDPFRVIQGAFQAYRIIGRINPNVLFSKGGFVAVPVIFGAWLHRVPILIHESDYTPGLANRLSMPFASKILTTFPETERFIKKGEVVHVGAVVREELRQGNSSKALSDTSFTRSRPVLLIMGGSLGSKRINQVVRESLDSLLTRFQVVHICGKGNIDPRFSKRGYIQYEFVREELPHLLALADLVVSRAGANSIYEFLSLKKPMLLIPLSRSASRGDQILNAESFARHGYASVLMEEELTPSSFLEAVLHLYENRQRYIEAMNQSDQGNSLERVISLIKQTAG
ncbi:UDP-N-acetylglucosamine--N-acetylmuramyl-(pentapeptide) pyrophosphoryl-undecaprenol N-acetylglucosamine transferase [[Clostridium] ultunense Esp]|uniref:undecaprenyldiphospho-muramoylpentapeptide beta-N-acetylglucosaminyltransferase n=1 Tax=Thermicanus aegyptius TaxID=94009 RepID=UPI0002B704E3|nr:undecaprenyldiphospho-muramoylpentapeptide beta-N-acetylglucosaminyltransferase [Thermicanus aegyptius]CCQ95714.1 UDP-N-acetylglucosamine--N-acetylmuramyl-(pentapeptide) pyrophosphoryl-undecaprenol N-acetylglucosamine transferase [[Clostridium] ultunense Esp]